MDNVKKKPATDKILKAFGVLQNRECIFLPTLKNTRFKSDAVMQRNAPF